MVGTFFRDLLASCSWKLMTCKIICSGFANIPGFLTASPTNSLLKYSLFSTLDHKNGQHFVIPQMADR